MASSEVEIANLALLALGKPGLTSLNDSGNPALLIRAAYEPTVREVLRMHPWRCCRRKTVLSADPNATPEFGFDDACTLPADFIRVVKVNDNLDQYQVVGKHLHIDDDAPELTYTARRTEDYFDAGLVSTIAARLAVRICFSLTDNASLLKDLRQDYAILSRDAMFADAMDGAPEDQPISTFDEARLSEP